MLNTSIKIHLIIFFCLTSQLFAASNFQNKTFPSNPNYGFIENKGQFVNQDYEVNKDLKFLLYNNNFNIHLKNNGFSYELFNREIAGFKEKTNASVITSRLNNDTIQYKYNFHRIDFEFVNYNEDFSIETFNAGNDFINYYYQWCSNGILNVKHYQRIVYRNFYQNIDLEFLVSDNSNDKNHFKYNFIIHPSANYKDIKFKINGSNYKIVNQSGEIEIETSIGKIIEKIPLTFQPTKNGKTAVHSIFKLNKNENSFGFDINQYDKDNVLIIDPMPWSTYYGGNQGLAYTEFYAVESKNNLIAGTGYTSSLNAIATSGAFQTSYAGGNNGSDQSDAFLVVFNNNCERLWATYYGGTFNEQGRGVRFDKAGNLIMAGFTFSLGVIASSGSFQSTIGGGSDLFLVKFNAAGQRIWGTYFGGTASEVINSSEILAIDSNNHYIITGGTASAGLGTTGVHQSTHAGGADAIIVKFDSSGQRLWCTYFGGTGTDISHAIAIDTSGNIHIVGETTSSSGIASSGAHQQFYGGNYDGFIAKFNPSGVRIWGTYFGGIGLESTEGVACDMHGNIAITGSTSSGGMATLNAHQTTFGGIYISKFNKNGIQVWSTYYGVSFANDGGGSVIFDNDSNIIASGSTRSASNIASPGAFQTQLITQPGGIWNAYIVKFNSVGLRIWGTYFGGNIGATIAGISATSQNYIIASGTSTSTTHVATSNSFLNAPTGSGILAAFTPSGDLVQVRNNHLTGNQTICARSTPDTLFGALPLGVMVGNFSYQWLSSQTDSSSGFTQTTGISNQQHYKPSALTQTTWFRRVVISANKADTSHAIQITVLSKPHAGFSINNPGQCLIGNNFTLSDTSVFSGNYQRFWHLGNGINDTSTLPVVNKTYITIGTYQVKLLLINPFGCNDSIMQIISVGNKPVAAFTINNIQQCQNNNLFVFANQSTVSSGPLQYHWQFSTQINDTSTLPSPNKIYMQHGSYTVQLIANSWGCTDTAINNITVLPKPIAGFDQNSLTQCFKNNRFEFSDTSLQNGAGLLSRLWRFSTKPNDTSILQNPVKSFDTLGIFNVRLISLAQNGCRDTIIKQTEIRVTPTPWLWLANGTQTVQLLNSNLFTFAGGGLDVHNYSWDLGDTIHGQTWNNRVTRTYSSPAAYITKVFAHNNNGCSDTAFLNIKILPNTPTIQASNISFNNITNNTLRINWMNGNGAQRLVIARANAIVNVNPVNGSGYIANAVYGQGSNLGNGNFVVYKGTNNFVNVSGLNPLTAYHFAVFEFNGDSNLSSYRTPGLIGNQTTLPVTWLNFNAKLIDNKNVNLFWQTASEINNMGFNIERSFNNLDFENIGFVNGNGTTNTISTYYFTDNDMPDLSKNKYNAIHYRLKQTDFDGSFQYSKLVSVSLFDNLISDIKLFPNPNYGSFNILIPNNFKFTDNKPIVSIFDVLGNLVQTEILTDNYQTLILKPITKGLYFVNIKLDNENFKAKILVE